MEQSVRSEVTRKAYRRELRLFLPRSFIDSPQIGDYASFNVTANGNKIDYDEHLTPTDRMFLILFPNGTKSIVITPKPLQKIKDR